jgi:hypothetical protein
MAIPPQLAPLLLTPTIVSGFDLPLVYAADFTTGLVEINTKIATLQGMKLGVSRDPTNFQPTAVLSAPDFKTPSPSDPTGGMCIQMQRLGSVDASRTFYLGLPINVSYAAILAAEITFDMPDAFTRASTIADEVASLIPWAVGVNFKEGSEDDFGPGVDGTLGPTCHFKNNNEIKLNPATTDPLPPPKSYAQLAVGKTRFRLVVRLIRSTTLGYGDAELMVDGATQTGELPGVEPLGGSQVFTQVGFVVVSQAQTPDLNKAVVRARFQTFKLWALL